MGICPSGPADGTRERSITNVEGFPTFLEDPLVDIGSYPDVDFTPKAVPLEIIETIPKINKLWIFSAAMPCRCSCEKRQRSALVAVFLRARSAVHSRRNRAIHFHCRHDARSFSRMAWSPRHCDRNIMPGAAGDAHAKAWPGATRPALA